MKKLSSVLALAVALVGMLGCDRDRDRFDAGEYRMASGFAFKGPLANASVQVFALLDTGGAGALLGSATTDATGSFAVPVGMYSGWTLIAITGGTYTDEATGMAASVPVNQPLWGFADTSDRGAASVVVSPLTTVAYYLLQAQCQHADAFAADQVPNALRMTARFFGADDFLLTPPANLTSGPAQAGLAADHAAAIAAIAQHAFALNQDTMVLTHTIGQDLQDLAGDGLNFGTSTPNDRSNSLTSDLLAALSTFLTTGRGSVSGLSPSNVTPAAAFQSNPSARVIPPLEVWGLVRGYGDVQNPVETRVLIGPDSVGPLADHGETYRARLQDQTIPVTVISSSELALTLPAGLAEGAFDLLLEEIDSGLLTRIPSGVHVGDSARIPLISRTSPDRGPLTGGTEIEIIGSHLFDSTEVRLDGILLPHTACFPPSRITVTTPPGTAGLRSLHVSNGGTAGVTIPDAFNFVSKFLRGANLVPSALTPFRVNATKLSADTSGNPILTTFRATTNPLDSDQGTFTLAERFLSTSGNSPTSRTRSGTAFFGNEAHRRSLLLFDSGNGLSDFLRFESNPFNGSFVGPTGNGASSAWPVPTNLDLNGVAGRYWVSGIGIETSAGHLGQVQGWLDLKLDGKGSVNLLEYTRDPLGTGYRVRYDLDAFDISVTPDGNVQGQSTSDPSRTVLGAMNGTSDLGSWTLETSTSLWSWSLIRAEYGQAGPGQGAQTGASIGQSILGGLSTFMQKGSRLRSETHADGRSLALEIAQMTESNQANPQGRFAEGAEFLTQTLSPSGVVRDEDGRIAGFSSTRSGASLWTGETIGTYGLGATADRPIAIGVSGHIDALFTHQSLSGDFRYLESSGAYSGQPASGGAPSLQLDLRTRFEPVQLEASISGQWQGRTFRSSGTIPTFTGSTTTGHEKTVTRDAIGATSVSLGVPQPFGGSMLYSGIGDQIYWIATGANDPLGRLAQVSSFPHLFGSYSLSSDGELARGAEPAGAPADRDLTLVRSTTTTIVPQGDYELGFLSAELQSLLPSLTTFRIGQGQLQFGANGAITTSLSHAQFPSPGGITQGSAQGQGLATIGSIGDLFLDLPPFDAAAPARTFVGALTPSGDFGIALDVTSGTANSGTLTVIRPQTGTDVFGCTSRLFGSECSIVTPSNSAAVERRRSDSIVFAPTFGQTNWLGEIRTRINDSSLIFGQTQFRATAPTVTGPGRGEIPFLGAVPVLRYLFSDRGRSIAHTPLTVLVTPTLLSGVSE